MWRTICSALLATAALAAPVEINKLLIAHWTFDEPIAGYERVPGVFGGAIKFTGQHRLYCDQDLWHGHPARVTAVDGRQHGQDAHATQMAELSFSAWVKPVGFDRYNEIFRKEDGDRRVLFSFQEHGEILSLGLNIGGYVE